MFVLCVSDLTMKRYLHLGGFEFAALLDSLGLHRASNLLLAMSYFRLDEAPLFEALLSQARQSFAVASIVASAAAAVIVLDFKTAAASSSTRQQAQPAFQTGEEAPEQLLCACALW